MRALLLFVVLVVGCAAPPIADEPPQRLANRDAWAAIVVDTAIGARVMLALCRDGDDGACVSMPTTQTRGLQLLQLTPGTWCVQQIVVERGGLHFEQVPAALDLQCFDVAAGAVAYPGHLEVTLTPAPLDTTAVRWRFVVHDDFDAAHTITALAPQTRDLPVLLSVVGPPRR